MDRKDEYHDPDYPEASTSVKTSPQKKSECENVDKIRSIVRREFANELLEREKEIMLIDQRMTTSRLMLHRLRYSLVNKYYNDQKLLLTSAQIQDEVGAQTEPRSRNEVSTLLRDGQRRLHPSVRKLLGKKTADLEEILLTSRVPRNTRKDYSAMLKTRVNPPSDKTQDQDSPQTPEPEEPVPKKVPRHIQPTITNIITLDEATRNQMKHRYRIIIGNTSKYAPASSSMDRSTHKWLLYIRGLPGHELSAIVQSVTVTLHHSYEPHHVIHLSKPPFHVSRRGWGEFGARVLLHFRLAARNRPRSLTHTLKLDQLRTGLQTLGAETIVDVWLYSTPEMLKYEFKEHIEMNIEPSPESNNDIEDLKTEIKLEPPDTETVENIHTDSWMDFFAKDTSVLDVDEMIIKPVKKENKNDLEMFIDSSIIKKSIEDDLNDNVDGLNDNVDRFNDIEIPVKNDWLDKTADELPKELLAQTSSPKKRIMKYMDPTTGKIYYLEIDRSLDVTKVQEIIINSKGNTKTAKISPIKPNGLKSFRKNFKKGVSLLKPTVQNQLNEIKPKELSNFSHINNDHCYVGQNWSNVVQNISVAQNVTNSLISESEEITIKQETSEYECLIASIARFSAIRRAVRFLLKNLPIITDKGHDPDYVKCFPYVVDSEERYWKLDFAKRRNIEWTRAKIINKILTDYFIHKEPIWRTKQILIFSRLHGYHPIRSNSIPEDTPAWSTWNIDSRNDSRSLQNSLSIFDMSKYQVTDSIDLSDSDDEVEIVNEVPVKVERGCQEKKDSLTVLPVESEEDRLRFIFIEKKSADIGIELRNEDVGNGYSYSAIHAVILSAVKNFAEEIIRNSSAAKLQEERNREHLPKIWVGRPSSPLRPSEVRVSDILTAQDRGAPYYRKGAL